MIKSQAIQQEEKQRFQQQNKEYENQNAEVQLQIIPYFQENTHQQCHRRKGFIIYCLLPIALLLLFLPLLHGNHQPDHIQSIQQQKPIIEKNIDEHGEQIYSLIYQAPQQQSHLRPLKVVEEQKLKQKQEKLSAQQNQKDKNEKSEISEVKKKQLGQIQYTMSQKQLEQKIQQMQYPPDRPKKFPQIQKSLQMHDSVYFFDSLSKNPNRKDFLQAEYYYYDQKYQTGSYSQQLAICVVMVGRNLNKNYWRMLDSLRRQNYTNYHGIYIDDQSDDGTLSRINKYLEKQAEEYEMGNGQQNLNNGILRDKIQIYSRKQQRKYALFNRNYAIRNYCHPGDIILDIDADDWLIGNQVFQLVNTLYQQPSTQHPDAQKPWAVYFNNMIYFRGCRCPLPNFDTPLYPSYYQQTLLPLLPHYRTSNIWRTTELRTFLYDLYIKIDEKDFIQNYQFPQKTKYDQKTEFYRWKSDSFMQFPIVELAGASRLRFVDEFVYFYDNWFKSPSPQRNLDRLAAKISTPYVRLNSLEEEGKKVENYQAPQKLIQEFMKAIKMQKDQSP